MRNMQKKIMSKSQIFFVSFILICGLFGIKTSYAAVCCCPSSTEPAGLNETQCKEQNCTWKASETSCVSTPSASTPKVDLPNPIGGLTKGQEVQSLIGRVIKVIMGLVGAIALLMFVYGGFLWMTAAGNDDKVAKGKEIFIWATAGLAVIFTSYIIVYFILSSLLGLS